MRLYGVVVVLGRWVRVGCARLSVSMGSSSVVRVPGCRTTRGAIPLSDALIIHPDVP